MGSKADAIPVDMLFPNRDIMQNDEVIFFVPDV